MSSLILAILAATQPFVSFGDAYSPEAVQSLSKEEKFSLYQADWLVHDVDDAERDVSVPVGERVDLLSVYPSESFRLLEDVRQSGKRKVLIPANTVLVRAPGALNVACEMLRQPGFERRTCVIDDDNDGRFDQFFRRLDTSPLLMVAAQSPLYPRMKLKPTDGGVPYIALDSIADLPPVKFQLRFNRRERRDPAKSENYLAVCYEIPELANPAGEEYFGRSCMASSLRLRDAQFPRLISIFGTSVLATGVTNGQVNLRIRPEGAPRVIKLSYE